MQSSLSSEAEPPAMFGCLTGWLLPTTASKLQVAVGVAVAVSCGCMSSAIDLGCHALSSGKRACPVDVSTASCFVTYVECQRLDGSRERPSEARHPTTVRAAAARCGAGGSPGGTMSRVQGGATFYLPSGRSSMAACSTDCAESSRKRSTRHAHRSRVLKDVPVYLAWA